MIDHKTLVEKMRREISNTPDEYIDKLFEEAHAMVGGSLSDEPLPEVVVTESREVKAMRGGKPVRVSNCGNGRCGIVGDGGVEAA